jgi:hypothetical protein
MSAGRVLRFTHRFRSGAWCEIEIDVEAVRDNSFTPHFRWRGTTHKAHEFICWARDVFRVVANHAGVPVMWCFVHRGSGATETWLFKPGEKPRRVAKADEPCRNAAAAIVLAATAKFATQSEV